MSASPKGSVQTGKNASVDQVDKSRARDKTVPRHDKPVAGGTKPDVRKLEARQPPTDRKAAPGKSNINLSFKETSGQTALEQSFGSSETASGKASMSERPSNGGVSAEQKPYFEGQNTHKVEALLSFENDIRQVESLTELNYLVVNDSKKLVSSELVLLHKPTPKGRLKNIELISSLALPDHNSPLLIWLNEQIDAAVGEKVLSGAPCDGTAIYIRLKLEDVPRISGGAGFPFSYALYVPHFSRDGRLLSAITYLKSVPFEATDAAFAERVGGTVSHAMEALSPRRNFWPRLFTKPYMAIFVVLVALAMFIPVTLTVLAPVEIVPDKPAVVSSPLSGVIDTVAVQPNARVEKGQLLFRLNRVELVNKFEVASRNVAVAEAKYRRATQGSFRSSESKRELAVTKAEYEMAVAERDFASARLAQTNVVATRSGVILYSGQEDWTGKPVVTGERIMRIADPKHVKMRIEVETGDAIILGKGAGVNAYFDSAPLTPVAGVLETQSYQAETTDANILVFPMIAAISGDQAVQQRIGLRGTAQIYGSEVPLWFFLFRKPISAVRQMIGL